MMVNYIYQLDCVTVPRYLAKVLSRSVRMFPDEISI